MRFTHKGNISRPFEVPFGPWLIPIVGSLLCILLLINTSKGTAIRFGIWMAIGHIIYFSYGFWRSKARLQTQPDSCVSSNELVPRSESVIIDIPTINLKF
jgi:APA family basic amino acid/polyamine antiporter